MGALLAVTKARRISALSTVAIENSQRIKVQSVAVTGNSFCHQPKGWLDTRGPAFRGLQRWDVLPPDRRRPMPCITMAKGRKTCLFGVIRDGSEENVNLRLRH